MRDILRPDEVEALREAAQQKFGEVLRTLLEEELAVFPLSERAMSLWSHEHWHIQAGEVDPCLLARRDRGVAAARWRCLDRLVLAA